MQVSTRAQFSGSRLRTCWSGMNDESTMLINKVGSFGSLGVIAVDVPTTLLAQPHPFRCSTCTQCITDCPGIERPGLMRVYALATGPSNIGASSPEPSGLKSVNGFGCDICRMFTPGITVYRRDERLWQPKPQHLSRVTFLADHGSR